MAGDDRRRELNLDAQVLLQAAEQKGRASEMGKLDAHEKRMLSSSDGQISLTDPDSRSHVEDMLPA